MQWKVKKGRKVTGGLLHKRAKKKRYQRGRDFVPTLIGTPKVKALRTRGDNTKSLALKVETANVAVSAGKFQKTKIIAVKENKANSQFIRFNIITKGCTIETDLGLCKVTSRPGRDGSVDAVLLEAKA